MARIGPGSCALNLHACTRDLVAPGSSGMGVRPQATLLRPLRQDDDGTARPSSLPGRRAVSPPRRSTTGAVGAAYGEPRCPRGIHLAMPLAAYFTGAYAEGGGSEAA